MNSSSGNKTKQRTGADLYRAVPYSALADGVTLEYIGNLRIKTNGIINSHISPSAAISLSKLISGTSAQIIVANSSGVPTYATMTGDVTISSTGVTTFTGGGSGTIALSKLVSGTSAQIIVANGSGVPTYVNMSGNVTINNTGVTTIGALQVTNGMLAGSIIYSKLSLSNSIVNGDINTSASIALSKLAALTASRVLVSDGLGIISVSSVTSTTLGYLDISSSLTSLLAGKQNNLGYTPVNKAGDTYTGILDFPTGGGSIKIPTTDKSAAGDGSIWIL